MPNGDDKYKEILKDIYVMVICSLFIFVSFVILFVFYYIYTKSKISSLESELALRLMANRVQTEVYDYNINNVEGKLIRDERFIKTVLEEHDQKSGVLFKDIKTCKVIISVLNEKLGLAIQKFDSDKARHSELVEELNKEHDVNVEKLRHIIKSLEDELIQLQIIYYTEHSS